MSLSQWSAAQPDFKDLNLVIVPCLNEAAHLPELLTTLGDDPSCGRLVVVDGGSSDGSQAIVMAAMEKDSRIALLNNPKRLQAAGVNLAVEVYGAEFEWMVRVDSHCRYPARYLTSLRDAAAKTGADSIVVPMVTSSLSGCFQRAAAAAQNSVLGTGGSAHRRVSKGAFVDHGHHALMRIAIFQSAGRYDESFRANEDAELDARITAGGGRIWLEPSAAITYFPRGAPWPLWLQYFRYGRGRAMTILRHKPRLHLRQVLPLAVFPAILMAVAALCLGSANLLLFVPAAAWAAAVFASGLVLGIRARSACTAACGLAAMIMHAAWSSGFWIQCLGAAVRRPAKPPTPFASQA